MNNENLPSSSRATAGSVGDRTPMHSLAADDVLKRLEVDRSTGLSSERAQELLKKHGHNQLEEAPPTPAWSVSSASSRNWSFSS
jgi:magnesium-transporting ATPase (P-type)